MRHHKKRRGGAGSHSAHDFRSQAAGEFDATDASDYGRFFEKSAARKRSDHKARQLCRQVFRTLTNALAGFGDDLLQDVVVDSVEPAPDASRLMVRVYTSAHQPDVSPADVLRRLHQAQGRLRSEVAAAIVRKRAPELSFHVIGGAAGAGEVSRHE